MFNKYMDMHYNNICIHTCYLAILYQWSIKPPMIIWRFSRKTFKRRCFGISPLEGQSWDNNFKKTEGTSEPLIEEINTIIILYIYIYRIISTSNIVYSEPSIIICKCNEMYNGSLWDWSWGLMTGLGRFGSNEARVIFGFLDSPVSHVFPKQVLLRLPKKNDEKCWFTGI